MESVRQILRDERGIAVVEFAFLLPIMLMLFVGVVEVTNLLRLERKVVSSAQTTADLITQRREVSNAQLNDILLAAELIFAPYPAAAVSVGVVGVRFHPNTGAPTVDWSRSQNGGSAPNALTVSQGLGQPGDGVVVVRVTYSYSPVFFDFILSPMQIEETAVLRPRRSSYVEGPAS
ncbi:MAG: TadE/TadG family type IV pilus assembly protein [Kiloniellaceae bacterium]